MTTKPGAVAPIKSQHWNDANGNPDGGVTFGNGFCISWQRGPLGRGSERTEPNGAFVEDVISAAIDRLNFYHSGKFACPENATTLEHLHAALGSQIARTAQREARKVEGTHQL
jgi:hypothetical protein